MSMLMSQVQNVSVLKLNSLWLPILWDQSHRKVHYCYFQTCDRSGLSCGLLMNLSPNLPTAYMMVNANMHGSITS